MVSIKEYLKHKESIKIINSDKKRGNNGFEYRENREKELQIIANGPSLLSFVNDINTEKDIMVVNDYIDSELSKKIIPKWYVIADPAYFTEEYDSFRKRLEEYCVKNDVRIFSQHQSRKKWGKKDFTDKYLNTILNRPLWKDELDQFELECFKYNKLSPLFLNVLIMAIYAGIQMGYKKIILFGADFNFMQQLSMFKGKLYSQSQHFYDGEGEKHYFEWGYYNEVKNVEYALRGFKCMKQYADYMAVTIINKNPNSFIEFFEFE